MASDLARTGPYTRKSSKPFLLASLFVLTMAFDFKGSEGGSFIQFAMFGINSAVFFLLAFRCNFALPTKGTAAYIAWSWLLFLILGSVGAIVSKVPLEQYIRVLISYSFFLEGFLVAWWLSRITDADQLLLKRMILSATISVVFTIVWGFYFTGRSISEIHFWVLSPLAPFLLVAAGYDLVISKRRRVMAALILIILITIMFISAVRGMLLVLVITAAAVSLGWLWNIIRGHRGITKPMVKGVGWVVFFGLIGLMVATIFDPYILDRWIDRTVGAGYDITFWTRVAAITGQWRELTQNSTSWLVGLGFGHDYYRDTGWFYLVSSFFTPQVYNLRLWYPSEFMWISPLFYGGFIAGSFVIISLLVGAIKTFRVFSTILRSRNWNVESIRPTMIGFLGYVSFLGISFTSNPFMSRLAPMFMGLCLGLIYSKAGSGNSPNYVS